MNSTLAAVFYGLLTIQSPVCAKDGNKANWLFERCAKGEFLKEPVRTQVVDGGLVVPLLYSGHTARLDDGQLVSFEQLQYQAEVIANEEGAAEEVFKHIDDDHAHMRVIAFEVLVKIAGRAPEGYSFGRPGAQVVGNKEWRDMAKEKLRKLIAEQAGASDGDKPPN